MALKPFAASVVAAFSMQRFGIIHEDGRFEDLTGRDYQGHPQAHRARWYGGPRDADLLYAALVAYDREEV